MTDLHLTSIGPHFRALDTFLLILANPQHFELARQVMDAFSFAV
jgi:hypothetical protein